MTLGTGLWASLQGPAWPQFPIPLPMHRQCWDHHSQGVLGHHPGSGSSWGGDKALAEVVATPLLGMCQALMQQGGAGGPVGPGLPGSWWYVWWKELGC